MLVPLSAPTAGRALQDPPSAREKPGAEAAVQTQDVPAVRMDPAVEAVRAQLGRLCLFTYRGMAALGFVPSWDSPRHLPLPHTRGRCHAQKTFQEFAILLLNAVSLFNFAT